MLDLTNPQVPVILDLYTGFRIHDLYVRNGLLFACSAGPPDGPSDPNILIFDISNDEFWHPITNVPGSPLVIPYPTDQSPSGNHPPHSIWLTEDGKHMVTADEQINGAAIFWDIQDLNMIPIPETDRFPVKTTDSKMHNSSVKGNFLYIAHHSNGLVVLDIYDINNVIEVANYDTYPDSDVAPTMGSNVTGAWGVFPYLPSCNIIVSDLKYGLFVLTFPDDEVLLNTTIAAGEEIGFVAKNTITATNYIVESGARSTLVAGDEIVIDGESEIGGETVIRIEDPCAQSTFVSQKTDGSSGNETNTTEKTKNNQSTIINQQSSISIHPNPTTGEFTIQVKGDAGKGTSEVYIYDLFGRLIYKSEIVNQKSKIVNISKHPKGIYLVKVIQGKEIFTKKLIHQ